MTRRRNREVERLVTTERAAGSPVRWAAAGGGTWPGRPPPPGPTAPSTACSAPRLATMREAMGADAVAVLLANDAGDELVARAASGLSEESTLDLRIRAGEGVAGTVLATRRSAVFDDLAAVDIVSPILRDSALRSIAAVPILFDEQPLGVLYAGSRKRHDFTGADVELLELMATRLAGAMERVRAFEREREARTRAERDADHLARLQPITSRLHAAATVEEIAAALTASLSTDARGTPIAWSNVWLVRGDNLELIPPRRRSSPWPNRTSRCPSTGSTSWRGPWPTKTLFVSDRDSTWMLDESRGVRASWAALPVLVQNECAGIVMVAYRSPHVFEEDERSFLRAVTAQAAQAMDRARLQAEQLALAEISQFFVHAARAIAEGSDFDDTLNRLATLALPVVGDICLVDVIGEDGVLRRMVGRHRDEARQPLVDRLASLYPPAASENHPVRSVVETGRVRWSDRLTDDFLRSDDRRRAASGAGQATRLPLLRVGAAPRRVGGARCADPGVHHPVVRNQGRDVRQAAGRQRGGGRRQCPTLRTDTAHLAHPAAEPAPPAPPHRPGMADPFRLPAGHPGTGSGW